MPSPPKKTPSDPDIEFGFGDGPEAPIGKLDALLASKPTPASRPKPRADQPTLPAPPDQPDDEAEPDAKVPRGVVRAPGAKIATAGPLEPTTSPAPADEARARDDSPLFGSLSDRPTKEAPAEPLGRSKRMIAPPPPKLPTLGPEPEFSFGLEDVSVASKSDPPVARRVDEHDLSWDMRPTGRPKAPARDEAPAPKGGPPPLSVGKPADPSTPPPLDSQSGDAHALVERASIPPNFAPADPVRELGERFALGDFSGALVIAESILVEEPSNAVALGIADECREKLQAMYTGRLGNLKQVPILAVPRAELKWLSLDHRAGFLLSLVDGMSTLEEIIDVSGMPALEVLRTLYELVVQRVIDFKPARR